MLTFASLFSGIGGFDLGFEQAGMQCAWQCEIDKRARSVLAMHWPGVPCYEDVKNVKRDNVAAVDLICGGFPDGWTVGQSDSARYRQLGNAVAVPVARWIGQRIVEASHA